MFWMLFFIFISSLEKKDVSKKKIYPILGSMLILFGVIVYKTKAKFLSTSEGLQEKTEVMQNSFYSLQEKTQKKVEVVQNPSQSFKEVVKESNIVQERKVQKFFTPEDYMEFLLTPSSSGEIKSKKEIFIGRSVLKYYLYPGVYKEEAGILTFDTSEIMILYKRHNQNYIQCQSVTKTEFLKNIKLIGSELDILERLILTYKLHLPYKDNGAGWDKRFVQKTDPTKATIVFKNISNIPGDECEFSAIAEMDNLCLELQRPLLYRFMNSQCLIIKHKNLNKEQLMECLKEVMNTSSDDKSNTIKCWKVIVNDIYFPMYNNFEAMKENIEILMI